MNIDHLKLFVRVASTHNISAAGQEFGLSRRYRARTLISLKSLWVFV